MSELTYRQVAAHTGTTWRPLATGGAGCRAGGEHGRGAGFVLLGSSTLEGAEPDFAAMTFELPMPLLLELPTRFETERLLIRCPEPGDGAIVHASIVESLPALRAFPASLPWAMDEPTVEASETFCREGQANYLLRKSFVVLMFLRGTDVHVGNAGLHDFDWSVPKCEIGYWARTRFTGQGLVTEAVRALTAFAFELGMLRVSALPDDENLPSCRVCERAGYALEGVLRQDRRGPDGVLRSTRVYATLR